MALVRSPDGVSIEELQKGDALPPKQPWASMANTGNNGAKDAQWDREILSKRCVARHLVAFDHTTGSRQ
jgi:hypothetical protein